MTDHSNTDTASASDQMHYMPHTPTQHEPLKISPADLVRNRINTVSVNAADRSEELEQVIRELADGLTQFVPPSTVNEFRMIMELPDNPVDEVIDTDMAPFFSNALHDMSVAERTANENHRRFMQALRLLNNQLP